MKANLVIDTLVFDESQITCPTNGLNPKWGGCVIPLQEKLEGQW